MSRVRTAPGLDGQPVILGAWCPQCGCEVMPMADGCCGWCDTQLAATVTEAKLEKRMGLPTKITEPVLAEARRLYAEGQSFRQIAALIFPRTGYKTERSCAESVYSLFRQRGWPTRSQRDVTIARNYRHGRKTRAVEGTQDGYAYRRWLKEQQGAYRPLCAAVKQHPPQKGRPCTKPAQDGSLYCYAHDPERAVEREAHLERMRALSPILNDREKAAA